MYIYIFICIYIYMKSGCEDLCFAKALILTDGESEVGKVDIHIYIHIYVCIYIYIERERL